MTLKGLPAVRAYFQDPNRPAPPLVPLVVACVALRFLYIVAKWDTFTKWGGEYEFIAQNFQLTGRLLYPYYDKLLPTALMPPGVTFLLIGLRSLWPHSFHFALAGLHLALSALSVWLLVGLSKRLFAPAAAWAVGLLFVIDLNLWIPTAWVNETVYTMFFVLLYVSLLARWQAAPSALTAAGTGLALGVGSLFRSTLIGHAGLVFLWMLWVRYRKKSGNPAHPAVFLLVFGLTLAPWTVRNYGVFGKIIPVSQNLGWNLWQGWNPESGGTEYSISGKPGRMEGWLDDKLREAGSEPEMNDILVRASIDYARQDPGRFFKQRVLSFLFFWHGQYFWMAESPYRTPAWMAVGFLNLFFIALFFVAFGFSLREGGFLRFILLAILLQCAIHTVIHTDVGNRFRYHVEPLMLVVIAGFLLRGRAPKAEPAEP